uniref:Uncharacterized protein n=1 Tax=Glossina morsitans morsitans TaxID=37546 RepID=A0A1B0FL73_GLOMM
GKPSHGPLKYYPCIGSQLCRNLGQGEGNSHRHNPLPLILLRLPNPCRTNGRNRALHRRLNDRLSCRDVHG